MMNKNLTNKKKKSLARTAKRKSLEDWSRRVRDRDKKCVVCERIDHLNAHHILSKENYKNLMLEIINGITLCPLHHKFGKFSAHKNPVWFVNFLQTSKKEQWAWALDNLAN